MGKQNGQRALTNAERQAKWRLAHGHKKAASDASRPKRALMVRQLKLQDKNLHAVGEVKS